MIPKITDREVRELYRRIRPVMKDDSGNLREIIGWVSERKGNKKKIFGSVYSLRGISFLWSPWLGKERNDLGELTRIESYHECGFYGFFKPDIGEVLAQIPERFIDTTIAFETDPNDNARVGGSGTYQIAETVLYRKRD